MKEKKYKQPDYCTCCYSEKNPDKLPCGKCGKIPRQIYLTVCGFILKNGICLCIKCHDKIDDCRHL